MILAALSVVGGWIGIGGRFERFLDPAIAKRVAISAEAIIPSETGVSESALMVASVAIALAGIAFAWFLYLRRTDLPAKIANSMKGFYQLVFHKYYVDELYDAMFVNRAKDLGLALGAFDSNIVDGLGVNGAGWLTRFVSTLSIWWDTWIVDGSVLLGARIVWLFGFASKFIQTGYVQNYMLLIVLGLIGFLAYYLHLAHHAIR
jgi:NADH-quinone oxidoreductase subunit L